jgi:hypothetical protein
MSWFKIYNLFRQPAPRNAATIDNYLPYGKNDSFPLEWAKAVSDSPSATSCLSTIRDFIEGFGFSDTSLEKMVVNSKGETLWQIHQKTVDDGAEFGGFYWLLKYNALGTPTEWEVLPFQNCRLGKPDDSGYISKIHYNPFFGTSEYKGKSKEQTVIYDVYNPNVVKEQIAKQKGNFKGQVFFFGNTTPLSPYYPINEAYAASRWMKIESGVSDYHEDNLNNGFLQPFMLVMRGNPSDPSTNPDYNNPDNPNERPITVGEEFDDVISKNFMGAKRVGNMFVQWVNNGDEAPTAVALPANNNGDLFTTLDNQATKKITIAWKVPAILANISEGVSLGGDGNAVRVAVKLMQQRVIKKQRVLTDNYQKILKNFITPYTKDIAIVPYNPYPELEIVDPQIWEALTPEERREWINDHTEIELSESTEIVEQPAQQVARITNAVPVAFPDKIKQTVKKALDYQDKMGLKCSGKAGREVSEMILNNQSMGLKQIKRIHSYLKKNELHNNKPFNEGCNVVEYNAWGGKDMEIFLEEELKRLNAWLN